MSRVAVLALALCGCSGGTDDVSFIAFASDFAGYGGWPSVPLTEPEAQGATHVAGASTIYINAKPPSGSTVFPIGTIIVKAVPSSNRVFAMAKRGGGFNAGGAVGWEWFEIQNDASIVWRGLGPPDGESYGGPGNTGCNNCHTGAWENDYVQAPLLLSDF